MRSIRQKNLIHTDDASTGLGNYFSVLSDDQNVNLWIPAFFADPGASADCVLSRGL
jgi:hypothetical protein